jgi:hypothetical protein
MKCDEWEGFGTSASKMKMARAVLEGIRARGIIPYYLLILQ